MAATPFSSRAPLKASNPSPSSWARNWKASSNPARSPEEPHRPGTTHTPFLGNDGVAGSPDVRRTADPVRRPATRLERRVQRPRPVPRNRRVHPAGRSSLQGLLYRVPTGKPPRLRSPSPGKREHEWLYRAVLPGDGALARGNAPANGPDGTQAPGLPRLDVACGDVHSRRSVAVSGCRHPLRRGRRAHARAGRVLCRPGRAGPHPRLRVARSRRGGQVGARTRDPTADALPARCRTRLRRLSGGGRALLRALRPPRWPRSLAKLRLPGGARAAGGEPRGVRRARTALGRWCRLRARRLRGAR